MLQKAGANLEPQTSKQMKSKLFKTITIMAAAGLALGLPLRADDNGDGDDGQRGGDVQGTENLEQEIVLAVTADAPADATGEAKLEADDNEGTSAAVLKIKTRGLVLGTYTVSTTSLADGTTVTVLGTFDVVDASHGGDGPGGGDDGPGDDFKAKVVVVRTNDGGGDGGDGGDDDGDGGTPPVNDTKGCVEFGSEDGPAFPDGFNPLDIGLLSIADANGVVVMTGDFSTLAGATTGAFTAHVRVTAGPLAQAASGNAAISAKVKNHHLKQTFVLAAKGLPANTKLNLRINGKLAGQVKTSPAGKVNLRKLPAGFAAHRVVAVSFENAGGVRAASAHF